RGVGGRQVARGAAVALAISRRTTGEGGRSREREARAHEGASERGARADTKSSASHDEDESYSARRARPWLRLAIEGAFLHSRIMRRSRNARRDPRDSSAIQAIAAMSTNVLSSARTTSGDFEDHPSSTLFVGRARAARRGAPLKIRRAGNRFRAASNVE